MNRRAKFDAASFILGGKIRNRTNTEENSKRYNYPLVAYRHVWIAITTVILTAYTKFLFTRLSQRGTALVLSPRM